jgi:Amidohydrolase family
MSRVVPLHIRNAKVWEGNADGSDQREIYTSDVVLKRPTNGAVKIDLEGRVMMPCLINAHDHLELNHYPRSKFRERYDNAHQWGEDVNARLNDEPFASLRAHPIEDRCFIGGMKNLLCGVNFVAHHNPLHKCLLASDFPVRVMRKYGWAHSLHFAKDNDIARSYRATRKDTPWFIHLAEGTDAQAAGEYARLKALGCAGRNTMIVHGVGMSEADIADACANGCSLVWCPTTNDYLLGATAHVEVWQQYGGRVLLGSDSRLTAAGDWLDEARGGLSLKRDVYPPQNHFWMQRDSALAFGDARLGHLGVGAYADWWVWGGMAIRDQIALIVQGGVPQIGTAEMMAKFPHIQSVPALLDSVPRRINRALAVKVARCSLPVAGLEVDPDFVRQVQGRIWK